MGSVHTLIKQELKVAEATVEELADFMETTVEKLKLVLDGNRKPTVAEAIKLSQFFDVDPMLFLGGR
jgi:plasmid maintenance system antidote protein VapI